MKVLVVYESMFGNTERIARAVASGMEPAVDVHVVDVTQAPGAPADDVALVVAGGPTHAFSMSRPGTRADAISRGAQQGRHGFGLREWLEGLPHGAHAQPLVTFDTRVGKVRHLPGSAARSAARVARRHGYHADVPPESFWVEDVDGPVVDGELERARAWGESLVAALVQPTG